MQQLKTLGGLRLESTPFTQPKPLVLLSYLSLEGSQQRRHLAELFWQDGNRMKSLSMTLTRLRQGVGEVVEVDQKQAKATLSSDAKALLEFLDKSQWQQASELYTGAFLEGVVLEDWSSELEEWVYTTREYLAERVQYALLNLAEETAKKQDFDKARDLAERAYKLPGLGGIEITNLKRLYPLLSASSSLLAPEVRKELGSYGITVQLSQEEARATFQTSKVTSQLPTRQTSFVGRDVELTELVTMLSKVQLLTLLGTAGVGKTRLALQLAQEQQKLNTFEHVYFVSLESLASSELILPTILSTLGLTQQSNTETLTQLADFIAQRSILLVLDNLEHLVENINVLSELIQQCPNLKLLVTSRERLNLEEEHLFSLKGLDFPTSSVVFEGAKNFDAVVLFSQRVQQLQPQFELKDQLEAVLRICNLVEGLPLGLELAASWVRLMSCHDIANEIQSNLEFLSTTTRNIPERHRSLKAAFEYSWKLLTPKEQEVLQKLSVFSGGFRREAASEVAGATIPILASLVDKSLLRVLSNGRYDQHPLMHQFAQEKLAKKPVMQHTLQQMHGDYFLRFLQAQSDAVKHYDYRSPFESISEDLANLHASWPQIVLITDEHVFRDARDTLAQYFRHTGQPRVGASWFETGLALTENKTHEALLLYSLAYMYFSLGQFQETLDSAIQALTLFEAIANPSDLNRAHQLLGRTYLRLGKYDQTETHITTALHIAEASADERALAVSYADWGQLYDMRGQFSEAVTSIEKALNLNRKLGHDSAMVSNLNNLGNVHLGLGELTKAKSFFSEGLDIARKIAFQDIIPYFLYNLAVLAKRTSDYKAGFSQCLEALQLSRDKGDKSLESSILGMLGVFATKLDQDEQAYQYLVLSLEVAQAIEDLPVLTENLFYIAELKGQQSKLEPAIILASFVAHHGATTGNNQAMALKFLEDLSPEFQKDIFEHLCSAGQAMTLEQVLEHILESSDSTKTVKA